MLSNAAGLMGAVLAGGRSRRFGSDKARAMLAGRTLLTHAASVIAPFVGAVVIVGADHEGYERVADYPCADMGPLGGLCGALRHARAIGFAGVVTIACDMPSVSRELVAELCSGGSRYCASAPVLGCWDAGLYDELLAHLVAGGDRSVRGWARRAGVTVIDAPPLPNVNTPEDLAAL